jgi:phosphoglucomutase
LKYNPPHGGPADTGVTRWIEDRANALLQSSLKGVRRISYEKAVKTDRLHPYDYITSYTEDLKNVVDLEAIRSSGVRIGVDSMGGSTLPFWEQIAQRYGLNLDVVNSTIDPTFGFMTMDYDGRIRMDCSSPYAMARLIELKDKYDIAFGNDPDGDRHGIVAPGTGLMNPNHYLSVAIWYLFHHRPKWRQDMGIGKTLVTSSMIDRITHHLGKNLSEVPVGFKWFVNGLMNGTLGFAGEESAGASFLRKDGTVWTTDKDGFILNLLAAEMTARTGSDPGVQYQNLMEMFGHPIYERIDAPATPEQKEVLGRLSPSEITGSTLAGEIILAKLTAAPGNNAPLGGIKVVTQNGWFAVRPSGTENVHKMYAESFKSKEHLTQIQEEARAIIETLFRTAGVDSTCV